MQQQIICPCSGTTKEKIQTLVESNRVKSVDDLSRITGTCSGCGGCESEVLEILTELTSTEDSQ